MKKNRVTYLSLADIHLGHNKVKSSYIIKNLKSFFYKYKKDILISDIIFIFGDTFDRLLSNASEDSIIAYSWLSELLLFCKNNNIKLRILEGTPSHDRKQVKQLTEIIKNLGLENKVDYKYFDTLDIEYMEDLDLHILYLPDEYRPTAEETLKAVKEKLKEHNLERADIIAMHGAFKYQIPNIDSPAFHDQDVYKDLANYTVNCGHVHNRSNYENILVPGSFERLTFADENDKKGGLLVTLKKDKGFDYKVLINDNTAIFKTFELEKNKIEDIKKELEELNNLKDRLVFVRFLGNMKNETLLEFRELYPNIKFTITTKSEIKRSELLDRKNIDINIKLDKDKIMKFCEINYRDYTNLNWDIIKLELENIL